VYVGVPTVYTILDNKLAPWLAERYLAKTGVNSQQSDQQPTPYNADGNLFEPPDAGDPGAHGRFRRHGARAQPAVVADAKPPAARDSRRGGAALGCSPSRLAKARRSMSPLG
jgi:hypothetical protein